MRHSCAVGAYLGVFYQNTKSQQNMRLICGTYITFQNYFELGGKNDKMENEKVPKYSKSTSKMD